MRVSRTAVLLLIGIFAPSLAAAQTAGAPTLDCTLGFQSLRAATQTLVGAAWQQAGGYDIATLAEPDTWRAQISFTQPGHPAHPAVTLRTSRKQVTGVWTADSKGCGYGNQGAFTVLMADMKSGDTELTNASRVAVERGKQNQSPLAPAP
jgi:hypothetical protein